MPISLTALDHNPLCHGHCWQVGDEDELARCVARVLMGHSRHVERIIAGLSAGDPRIDPAAVQSAMAAITLEDGEDPWHRDGLVFQLISWIAARRRAGAGTITRAPHLVKAQKGFDGIEIEVDFDTQKVSSAVLCEDKATSNPRQTIREDVWPELKKIEGGERRNELAQEISMLLLQVAGKVDYDSAIETLLWDDVRGYRVSITIGDTHSKPEDRKRLFNGYDDCVGGPHECNRRGAETFYVENLRPWMEQFCARVIAVLNAEFVADV